MSGTYKAFVQEHSRITFQVTDDLLLLSIGVRIEAEPNPAEIQLLNESLKNSIPSDFSRPRLVGCKVRPAGVV